MTILCSELLWKEAIAERQASKFIVSGIHLLEKASKTATISTEQYALAVTQHFDSTVCIRAPSLPGIEGKTANASAQAPSLIPAVDDTALSLGAVSDADTATKMVNIARLDSVHSKVIFEHSQSQHISGLRDHSQSLPSWEEYLQPSFDSAAER